MGNSMTDSRPESGGIIAADSAQAQELAALAERAGELVKLARKAGADSGDAVISRARSRAINVRLGKVEETEASESDDFSLRVFIGKRVASVSAGVSADLRQLAERAVAMAKVSPENPFEGEAEAPLLARNLRRLGLYDNFTPGMADLEADARALEEAALAVKGVSNSGGAMAAYGVSGLVLATSAGFSGAYAGSYFSRSVSAVAGAGAELERDYDYSAARHYADMDAAAEIGRRAGEQAVARLGGRQMPTGRVDVIFAPRVARSLAGHLSAMVNGAAVARGTSLLQDYMDKRIMPAGLEVTDNPLRPRGPASHPFDGEGVAPQPLAVVEDGILRQWLLSCSAARELGLQTNGHGARAGNAVSPAAGNFAIEPGDVAPEALIGGLKRGFYVTELVGHGVDLVSGQYSRGASGFWIENGVFACPVSEVTLASDLRHIFAHMTAADDIDRRHAIAAPTLLVEGMMLAGR